MTYNIPGWDVSKAKATFTFKISNRILDTGLGPVNNCHFLGVECTKEYRNGIKFCKYLNDESKQMTYKIMENNSKN